MDAEVRVREVLLVEDDPDDIEFTRLAFKECTQPRRLHVAQDGEEALAFLHRDDGHATAPRPDLILLDLGLPRMDGKELLRELKRDPALSSIPVVALTSSRAREDVLRCYALGVNAYIQKPSGFDEVVRVVHDIEHFWLDLVVLPDPEDL